MCFLFLFFFSSMTNYSLHILLKIRLSFQFNNLTENLIFFCYYYFIRSEINAVYLNPLSARIFTVFDSLLEDRVLQKEAWVAKLIQVHKEVKFSRQDISSLAVKGLIPTSNRMAIRCDSMIYYLRFVRVLWKSEHTGCTIQFYSQALSWLQICAYDLLFWKQ